MQKYFRLFFGANENFNLPFPGWNLPNYWACDKVNWVAESLQLYLKAKLAQQLFLQCV